jgi:two-component system response regulator NreC
MIRILLADDHTILREGIRALLGDEPDMAVVGEADNGRWAVEQARTLKPDVVLMDIAMPLLNGLEATRQIRREQPDTHVLILTMHQNEEYVPQVLDAGASGYVLKHAAGHELVAAIRAVAQGDAYFSPEIARTLVDAYVGRRAAEPTPTAYDELTDREREILQLVAEGYTNREIAAMLSISIKTVKTHRLHLMHKLQLHDRGELIKYAIQKGIISP